MSANFGIFIKPSFLVDKLDAGKLRILLKQLKTILFIGELGIGKLGVGEQGVNLDVIIKSSEEQLRIIKDHWF